jgi:hypothetical protein
VKISDQGQCRDIKEWIGVDLSKLSPDERVEFACASNVGEAGMVGAELYALMEALDTLKDRPIRIVETGMGWAYSTRMFMTHILKYGGELNTIEYKNRARPTEYLTYLGLWNHPKFKFHAADTREIYWPPDKLIDFLLIDSEHALSDALGEYMKFRHFFNGNAIVAFHDTDCCPGVARAIEIAQEMDTWQPLTAATNILSAGLKTFRIMKIDDAVKSI